MEDRELTSSLSVTVMEIYNEKIKDLLSDVPVSCSYCTSSLRLKQHNINVYYV